MMTATSTILRLPHPGGDALVVRACTIVSRTDTGLVVSDSHGVRRLDAGWSVWRHELSSDGRYVMALDADGSRGQVWDARTGAPLLALAGGSPHRHSLRAGLAEVSGAACALVDDRRDVLSVFAVADGRRAAWLNLSGWVGFRVERIVALPAGWLAVHGSRHAEQYYTVALLPGHAVLRDTEILQTTLRERTGPSWWGYEIAAGPAGDGQVVIARNPEWDAAQRPDHPDDDLRGFLVWDLAAAAVVQRVPYDGEIPNGGAIGADAHQIAIERNGHVELIARAGGRPRIVPALALDPYRMTVARAERDGIAIAPIE